MSVATPEPVCQPVNQYIHGHVNMIITVHGPQKLIQKLHPTAAANA